MNPEVLRRSGSRAQTDAPAPSQRAASAGWQQEWRQAAAREAAEAAAAERTRTRTGFVLLVLLTAAAALVSGIFPLTPGFSSSDATAAVVAALVAAAIAVAVVPLGDRLGRRLPAAGADDRLVYLAALASVDAAAIHLSVAKMHFDEYTLFGLFFVGSGVAQFAWPVWVLLRRWRPLLWLGAVGNALIVALWAVDRIWGLPLGPDPWKPDPVGFGDSVTSGFEVVLVAACVALLVRGPGRRLQGPAAFALTSVAFALTALSLLSVLGVAPSLLAPTQ